MCASSLCTPAYTYPSWNPVSYLALTDATGTKLTNSGLERLYPLKNLTELILNGTEVTPQAAADFQKALPQCRVSR